MEKAYKLEVVVMTLYNTNYDIITIYIQNIGGIILTISLSHPFIFQ